MGKRTFLRLIILSICFILTAIMVYGVPVSKAIPKPVILNDVLKNVGDWQAGNPVIIEPEIVKELNLDDYINKAFTKGKENVFLYIGYYLTKKKIGAAHDPMVCFPGQGYILSDVQKGKYILPSTRQGIDYAMMTVQRNERKDLVLYWFQSYDEASSDTFQQKIQLYTKQLKMRREDNAFVRITISLEQRSVEQALKIGFDFVDAFYPRFLEYIKM